MTTTLKTTCEHEAGTSNDHHQMECDYCGEITGTVEPCPRTGERRLGCAVPVPRTGPWAFYGASMPCPACDGIGRTIRYFD